MLVTDSQLRTYLHELEDVVSSIEISLLSESCQEEVEVLSIILSFREETLY